MGGFILCCVPTAILVEGEGPEYPGRTRKVRKPSGTSFAESSKLLRMP
jgi:hypothetical protein